MSNDSSVTPYRKTHVRFDVAQNTLREAPTNVSRSASQIASGHAGDPLSQNYRFVEPNALGVRPYNDDLSNLHQLNDASVGAIMGLADFDTVTGVKATNTWRSPADLLGVVVSPGVAPVGDAFMHFTVGAGKSWAQSKNADITAFGQIAPVAPAAYNVQINRVAVGKNVLPGNQGFTARIVVPAAAPQAKQVVASIYFGGPISTQVNGLIPTGIYGLVFLGTGTAELWMSIKTTPTSAPTFVKIDSWQGFNRTASTQSIACEVYPIFTSNGVPAIIFETKDFGAGSGRGGGHTSLVTSYYNFGSKPNTHVWYGWGNNGLPVTGPGLIRVDHPADVRPPFQISKTKYTQPAYVWDDAFSMNWFPTTLAPVVLSWQAYLPAGCQVVGALYDFGTGDPLTPTSTTSTSATYQINPGQQYYNAKFTLTPSDDHDRSPLLYGYKVIRNGIYGAINPGEFSVPDTYSDVYVRNVSITGPDKDLTHETASLEIEDPQGRLTKVNTRARIRTRIETEYDASDSTKRACLFEGFLDRADGRKKGYTGFQGVGQDGLAVTHPSPAWKEFQATFSGVWRRLREKLTMERVTLWNGASGSDGAPYKVTDICRSMLAWCGFSVAEIDVPDSPIQFYSQDQDSMIIQPLAEIGDVVAGFLHDYLGWFLVWDANAGTTGMIRAVVPPPLPGPYTILADFTLDLPSTARTLTHKPGAYGSLGWYATQPGGPGTNVTIPIAYIRKRTFQTHVKPPEANAVHVTGTGIILPNQAGQYQLNQWAWNPKSYDFFVDGSGNPVNTADPNDPDYIGEMIPLVIVNTSLGGGINDPVNGVHQGQNSVDILTRRFYDAACRAQKWAMFEAPLVLVIDPNDTKQSAPRPLRYYDAVTLTSGGFFTNWLVRSCNPIYRKDSQQWAHYELLSVPT